MCATNGGQGHFATRQKLHTAGKDERQDGSKKLDTENDNFSFPVQDHCKMDLAECLGIQVAANADRIKVAISFVALCPFVTLAFPIGPTVPFFSWPLSS